MTIFDACNYAPPADPRSYDRAVEWRNTPHAKTARVRSTFNLARLVDQIDANNAAREQAAAEATYLPNLAASTARAILAA